MDNLQNLLRLAGEMPIIGTASWILAVLFFAIGLVLGVYFLIESWKDGNDNSKTRRYPYSNGKKMKILSCGFVFFVVLFFVVWMVLVNHPNFSRETTQRLTAGGREPILFSVRILLSGSIFLVLSFIGILGIIFADWYRGNSKAKVPL